MALRALFLTEAGSHTGMGHLVRCSALADALAERGVVCEFWLNLSGEPPRFDLPHRQVERAWHGSQPPAMAELQAADFVVVDSYLADTSLLQSLADSVLCTLMLDDFLRCAYPQQSIVLNGSPGAETLAYQHARPRLLLGTRFALLRAPFRHQPQPVMNDQIETVLVTLGGGDTAAQVGLLVDTLRRLRPHWRILALAAAGVATGPQVETFSALPAEEICWLMQRADLAISAGGQTLYELAALGVPTLAYQLAENQAINIQNGRQAGFLHALGALVPEQLEQQLAAALEQVEPLPAREQMSAAGLRWVDGKGAPRVADYLLHSRPEGQLFQQLSEPELLEILAWRNSDSVRLHMVHPEIITPEKHLAFCHKLQDNPCHEYWRVSQLGENIGVVTLAYARDGRAELGLYKNPALSFKAGAILMRFLFEQARQQSVRMLTLKVQQSNRRAWSLYQRYGFVEVDQQQGYVWMEKTLER